MRKYALLFHVMLYAFVGNATDGLLEKLSHIQGATVQELQPRQGYRLFDIRFLQPADHFNPHGEQFQQRLILWHKDESRPMVLQTSGYKIFSISLAALASSFNANQIQVEHRFFDSSTPASKNWRLHTIEQSANDFHRITQAFKAIYPAKWVNTGRSKGGMTSVYHRRFFPNDVDATVAHVAPQSYSVSDPRYANFVANEIGGEENALCRAKLIAVQRTLLQNRPVVFEALEGNFNFVGSKEHALEFAVIELPWAFWQYNGPNVSCSNVPDASAPLSEHIDFLVEMNDPANYTDEEYAIFSPYYYQAAAQLGNPETPFAEIADLLQHEDDFNVFSFVPRLSNPVFDYGEAMIDVAHWLANESTTMLFVYGAWDPWSGGAFEPNPDPTSESFIFYVPKANHSAQFIDLTGNEKTIAYSHLKKWLNIEDELPSGSQTKNIREVAGKTLEDIEFELSKTTKSKL